MMFLLSKLLPLLVLPLGLALLLLVTALIRHRRWPVTGAFALLWVFATPLVADALWRLLEHPHQRRPAAAVLAGRRPRAVVVLGGGRHAAPGPAGRSSRRETAPASVSGTMLIDSSAASMPTTSSAARACALA